jgi:hypothetical protein
MAAKAKLSILGLYQWNNSIFDDMEIPEEIDAETVKWEILEECAELEILYPDPDFMKESIKYWSRRMLPNWQKIVDALIAEYNPIWNKDGKITDTMEYGAHSTSYGKDRSTASYGQDRSTAAYGEDRVTAITGRRDQTNTHSVAGFNESTMQNAEQDHSVGLEASDTNTRASHNDTTTRDARSDTTTRDARTDTSQAHTDKRTIIEQGNIGVTESSAMVRHEVELRAEFNIYQIIANDFKKKYCLMVY